MQKTLGSNEMRNGEQRQKKPDKHSFSLFCLFIRFLAIILLLTSTSASRAKDLTPKSPEVSTAIEKAVRFLQTEGPKENRLGGQALICMALVKAGVEPDHPFVVDTVKRIQAAIPTDGGVNITDHIYTAGLITMFLADLDADKFRRELDALGKYLEKHQRTDGSWTYLTQGTADNYPSGDMSMTQYAVMALWTLHQERFEISPQRIERAAVWLVSVQNQEGAYAYQTTVSKGFTGEPGQQISWNGVRLSMSAAGMASVYVSRDLLGFNRRNREANDKIHEAFTEVKTEEPDAPAFGDFKFSVPKSRFDAVQGRGNRWLERHFYPITSSTEYYFYYLYALERYGAFRELAENKHFESPPWYDRTAKYLLENQAENGSWAGNLGAAIDTAYAVLFLLRSTRRTFDKIAPSRTFGGGELIGGRNLPKLTDDIKVRDGQIVSLAEITNSEQLLQRLAEMDEVDDETISRLAELPDEEMDAILHKERGTLQTLVAHPNAEKRLAAVSILRRSGDLSSAPALIFALDDPDPAVAQAALDALNRLDRRPTKENMPKDNEPLYRIRRQEILDHWKNWFRQIDPEAVFETRSF